MSASVVIVLSTYNGEQFIGEQIESLLRQTYRDFVCFIRDDGSRDRTLEIVKRYTQKYPSLFVHVQDERGNLGAADSFLTLLGAVEGSAYTMFCDQDDVWFPDKIEKFLGRMQQVESGYSEGTPILIFGDMVVTDQVLSEISSSFWRYQKIETNNSKDWRKLVVSNCVTGCSSLMNVQARNLLKKFGRSPVLHDLTAAVLVAKHGIVEPLQIPTMYYRQHAVNMEGARPFGVNYLFLRARRFVLHSIPGYVAFCRMVDLPLWRAMWLKGCSVISRLLFPNSR